MTTFSHLALTVSDLDPMTAFYREVFEFRTGTPYTGRGRRLSRAMEVPNAEIRSVFLRKDGFFLELLGYSSAHRRRPLPHVDDEIGYCHLAFIVADLDEVAERVVMHGGAMREGTRTELDFGDGIVTTLDFCTDPEGNRIELILFRDASTQTRQAMFLGVADLGWPYAVDDHV